MQRRQTAFAAKLFSGCRKGQGSLKARKQPEKGFQAAF